MKIKVSELSGIALDWSVAYVKLGKSKAFSASDIMQWARINKPSSDWSQGGPIIEREKIKSHYAGPILEWECWCNPIGYGTGETPLIAAMRCYVASKLGEEVEVPDELINKE